MGKIIESQKHSEKVERLFTKIARRYDLANDLQSFFLHRLWKKRVADLAEITKGSMALDLCCGTGDIAFELAKRGASVVAIDFSQTMLEHGINRWQSTKNSAIATRPCCPLNPGSLMKIQIPSAVWFMKADCLTLPFKDNSFDAVTIGYGLRNLSDWKRGLSEMLRVTKKGGRVLILEFGKPESRIWRSLYFWYLRRVVPWLGKITAGDFDAYYYIYESLIRYPGQFIVNEEMAQLGCHETRIINILGGAMTINYGKKG